MTTALLSALCLASFACAVIAKPAEWADGKVTEAISWKLLPITVELTTADGVEKVELSKLHSEWVLANFQGEDLASVKARLEALIRHIDLPYPGLSREQLAKLPQFLADLQLENVKLKARLEKLEKPKQAKKTRAK